MATAKTLHAAALNVPASLVEYVMFGFFLGKEIIIVIGTILAIYFLHKHFWRELAMVWIGLGGGGCSGIFSAAILIVPGRQINWISSC